MTARIFNEAVIVKAMRLAERAHRNHKRKYTGDPYIVHPLEVAEYLAEAGMPAWVIAGGLLHDVIEDAGITEKSINVLTGDERVGPLVTEVTEVYSKEAFPLLNRADRKARELERLSKVSYFAKTIKYADFISNTKDILEHDEKFARTYLAEIRDLLKAMYGDGDNVLYSKAKRAVNKGLSALAMAL